MSRKGTAGRSASSKAGRAKEEAARREEERERQEEEAVEKMLPWEVENKVSCLFSIVKIPFILFVGFFGTLTEWQVRALTVHQWSRDKFARAGEPSCFVHRLDMSRAPKHAEYSLVNWMNRTILRGTLGQKPQLSVAELKFEMANRDLCGFNRERSCRPEAYMKEARGGAMNVLPMAFMWTVYKIMFIGVHPIDRLAKKHGVKQPYLKLLTEPYMQKPCMRMLCTVFVKVQFYVRYKLVPNVMLTALATMEMHPRCTGLLRYRFDWFWSSAVYALTIVDLMMTIGFYAYLLQKDSKVIGTKTYRAYKTWWFISSNVPAFLVFWDVAVTIQWNLARILRINLRVVFTFDIAFAFYVDILQFFLFFVVLLEGLEFSFMIMQVCCPILAKRFNTEALDRFDWLVGEEEGPESEAEASGVPLAGPGPAAPTGAGTAVADAAPSSRPGGSGPAGRAKDALRGLKAAFGPKTGGGAAEASASGAAASAGYAPLVASGAAGATSAMDEAERPACRRGCGRRAAPGLMRSGKPYDTCCRSCAKGSGHDGSCVA